MGLAMFTAVPVGTSPADAGTAVVHHDHLAVVGARPAFAWVQVFHIVHQGPLQVLPLGHRTRDVLHQAQDGPQLRGITHNVHARANMAAHGGRERGRVEAGRGCERERLEYGCLGERGEDRVRLRERGEDTERLGERGEDRERE